jgi:DNA topoisomerase IA
MQPTLRFNQASLLEQIEKEQIRTKNTRAEIIVLCSSEIILSQVKIL